MDVRILLKSLLIVVDLGLDWSGGWVTPGGLAS